MDTRMMRREDHFLFVETSTGDEDTCRCPSLLNHRHNQNNQYPPQQHHHDVALQKQQPHDQAATLLSEALSSLTMQEREQAYDDVHCIPSAPIHETPELIHQSLIALEWELQRLRRVAQLEELQEQQQAVKHGYIPSVPPVNSSHKSAAFLWQGYLLAEQDNCDYVRDDAFRLDFLRVDSFQVGPAAMRILRHFQYKLKYFGRSSLCRTVTWDQDLQVEDQRLIREGFVQVLPVRDQADRIVIVATTTDEQLSLVSEMARVIFYICTFPRFKRTTTTADHRRVIPLKAVFVMLHCRTDFSNVSAEGAQAFQECYDASTLSFASFHHCISSNEPKFFKWLFRIGLSAGCGRVRARTKLHEGSITEWIYTLMTFGIPQHCIPLTNHGKLKTKACNDYFDMKRRAEQLIWVDDHARTTTSSMTEDEEKKDCILVPGRADVLMGKGSLVNMSPGNQSLQSLVDARLDQYRFGSRSTKLETVADVIFCVASKEGRFLSKEKAGVWQEIPFMDAKAKVTQTFHVRTRVQRNEQH